MAKVPLPERGQPLDVTYIYQVVEAVNFLSTQISDATYNYTDVDVVGGEKQSLKTSNTKFIGKFKSIANNETVTAGQEKSYSIDYSNFKFPPIVTLSIVNTSGTTAGANTTVVLTSVTTTQANFTVRYGVSGTATVGINLIAIGVPN
jgi:hypothetical protein